jgi:hypothetical protein
MCPIAQPRQPSLTFMSKDRLLGPALKKTFLFVLYKFHSKPVCLVFVKVCVNDPQYKAIAYY